MPEPTELLRANGLNVTAQRVAVLRAAFDHPHSSADHIADLVRSQIGAVSVQAVYAALAAFADKGILRKVQLAGSPALYDPRIGDNHHHAICRSCETVRDVDCRADDLSCLHQAVGCDYEIDETEVIYWGTCPECRAKNTAR
jgi:Fe2+ or Zn2+ uptake regulation protein